MTASILLNAARAFVHVSYADGQLSPKEAERFMGIVRSEPGLAGAAADEITAAWATALTEVQGASSYGATLVAIRSDVTSAWDKAMLMRIAQAALVADDRF
jgi:tellurite resistance protein